MTEEPKKSGGFREGAGRKKIVGGVRRMWTVPPDVDAVVQERGTKWLWEAARFKLAFEQMQDNMKERSPI